jgi:hypothetical protein
MITTNGAHSLCSSAKGSILQGAGVPLDSSTRSFMESRFGLPFGDVRVHTGPWAATGARALHSRAFTLGHNIVFGEGQYAPESVEGQRLLAHELVHVVQQRGAFLPTNHSGVTVGDPLDPLEAEAERVADEVFGRGPISSIQRDMAPAIRRVIRVDPASATISVDPGVSKAKPAVNIITVGPNVTDKVAIAHLTQGVNPSRVVTIDNPVIKMAGKLDVLLEPGDDVTLPGFRFGFIQIGKVLVLEDTYVGRTLNEGHIKLQHRLKVSPPVLLDTVAAFFPFSSRVGTFFAPVQQSFRRVIAVAVDLGVLPGKTGDSPSSTSAAVMTNSVTSAANFLFEFRADLGFTTVLVAIDPQKKIQSLANVNWHLVWHFQFKWRGAQNPTATVIPITSQANVGPVNKRSLAVTDPAVAALVATPIGPFFNDVTTAAKQATAIAVGQRPNREDNFSRPAGVPPDFFT